MALASLSRKLQIATQFQLAAPKPVRKSPEEFFFQTVDSLSLGSTTLHNDLSFLENT